MLLEREDVDMFSEVGKMEVCLSKLERQLQVVE
jgi:hypothetical protein